MHVLYTVQYVQYASMAALMFIPSRAFQTTQLFSINRYKIAATSVLVIRENEIWLSSPW